MIQLLLAFALQLVAPQPSFMYREGTACRNNVLTWNENRSEVILVTLPTDASRITSRSFPIGNGRQMIGARIYFLNGEGFARCGEDLGLPFDQVLAGRGGSNATSGTASVSVRGKSPAVVTVVLRDATFEWSGRRIRLRKPLRVTTTLNNTVAG